LLYKLTNMGRIVIVAYKPKPGKEAALKELMHTHLPRLKQEGLVRDKEPYIMEAGDGTIVEVFEWLSDEAIQTAHTNPEVQKMWGEYAEVCDYTTIGSLSEAMSMFSNFTALN
jgi:quinol monooxygenase YgiN